MKLEDSGEEGIALIKALCGFTRVVSNVNIPNTAGQIKNLPLDAVVETNALFERDSIKPLYAGELPCGILELTMPHLDNHERTLKAALTCDRQLLLEAFLHDPLIHERLSGEQTESLINEMLQNTRKYLPKEWQL